MVMQLELVSHRPPFPQLAEQAPPHEIASAAVQQKPQQKKEQEATADAAHTPEPAPKPKAGTGTNCNFNVQEQDKQHIELQKQHPDLPEQAPPHEIASAALNRKNSEKNSRSSSRCCSYPTAQTKPKAGTGTNCNLNAQEQGKQHIELQKQHLDLPEQAPPHEIASAALQQKQQQKQNKTQQQMLLTPHGPNETQSRTGTNCDLNAQEQDKQHIELQKQHPQMAEQAPPHEIASAALNRTQQKEQQKQQQMLLIPQSSHRTQSRNRHQLQFKCTGTRQAAHRIAETASRPARAGTSTRNCISSPPTETAAETAADGTADAAHAPEPEPNQKQEPAPTAI